MALSDFKAYTVTFADGSSFAVHATTDESAISKAQALYFEYKPWMYPNLPEVASVAAR